MQGPSSHVSESVSAHNPKQECGIDVVPGTCVAVPTTTDPGQSAGSSHLGHELQDSYVVLEIHCNTFVTLA